jgi:hypothetical protein
MAKKASESMTTGKIVIVGFLCILTFVILAVLNAANPVLSEIPVLGLFLTLPRFESPMFIAMPLFGFFGVFFLVDYLNRSFDTELAMTPLLPLTFFGLGLLAYFVALYWYMANFAALNRFELTLDILNFWPKLHTSSFFLFIWAGVFGWIARFAVEKIKLGPEEQSQKKE